MDWKVLKLINIISITVILLLIAFSLLLFKVAGPGILIGLFVFWLVLYLNLRKSMMDFINARMDAQTFGIDPKRERGQKILKCSVIGTGIVVSVFALFLFPLKSLDEIFFTFFLIAHIMIAASFLSLFLGVIYLVFGKVAIDRLSLFTSLGIAVFMIAFAWFYMKSQFSNMVVLAIVVPFLLFSCYAIRRSIAILKDVSGKRATHRREQLLKLVTLGCILAIVAVIPLSRYLHAEPPWVTIFGLMILLLIAANAWKFIKDISG